MKDESIEETSLAGSFQFSKQRLSMQEFKRLIMIPMIQLNYFIQLIQLRTSKYSACTKTLIDVIQIKNEHFHSFRRMNHLLLDQQYSSLVIYIYIYFIHQMSYVTKYLLG